MNTYQTMLVGGSLIAVVLMSVLWCVQRRTGNAGIVDIGWSGLIPLLAVFYAYATASYGDVRTLAALGMAVLWGGRLVVHIHRRSKGHPEDARYADLRKAWGNRAQLKLFVFFQFQAAAAILFSVPAMLVMLNRSGGLTDIEIAGILLWGIAWGGECASDWQLAQFKRDPANRGKVCTQGWWNYSRHPNYFFEWLIWCAWALFALSSPYGFLAVICPALMFFFLFKVTGIPATEAQALRSKGDAYREYQRTTSAFVPWFKRS